MEAYPPSIRRRIIALYRSGESTEEIAERFGYCVAGVRRVRQRFEETGSIEPRKTEPGRKPALDAAALERLSARVALDPDATLAELDGLGADINHRGVEFLLDHADGLCRACLSRDRRSVKCRASGQHRLRAERSAVARPQLGAEDAEAQVGIRHELVELALPRATA